MIRGKHTNIKLAVFEIPRLEHEFRPVIHNLDLFNLTIRAAIQIDSEDRIAESVKAVVPNLFIAADRSTLDNFTADR